MIPPNTIGIYKITSPTNKIYIGSSCDIANRYCTYKNIKCYKQRRLYNSLKKHGFDNHKFEIIEECTIEVLYERELYYGTLYNVLSREHGLNCRLPKSYENFQYMSEETKKKISESNKGKSLGKKHDYYESKLKKLTPNQVRKIKKLLLENKLTQKEIGKKFNVSRKIISDISTGKNYSNIHQDIDILDRQPSNFKLSIQDVKDIRELYKNGKSQTEIAKIYNVTPSNICRIVNNKYRRK